MGVVSKGLYDMISFFHLCSITCVWIL